MISVTIYETATGVIRKTATLQQTDIVSNIPDGCGYIEGTYSSAGYYVVNGAAVPIPAAPSSDSTWDGSAWTTPTTQELEAEQAQRVRDQRSALLAKSDWTQLPDVDATTSSVWATYRQALRDITAQAGFPYNVTWPNEP